MDRKTLILINSSQVLMEITGKILERAGYIVHCAVGVAGAQEQLIDRTPDAIILDSELPDGSGLDLCGKLCDQYDIPIIFISANKDDELPALQAGAYDFLKKPYNYDILKTRIGIMLNAKSSQLTLFDDNSDDSKIISIEDAREAGPFEVYPRVGLIAEQEEKGLSGMGLFYRIAATCIIIIIIGVIAFTAFYNSPIVRDFQDLQVPIAEFLLPDENAAPGDGNELFAGVEFGEKGYLIPKYDSVTMSSDGSAVKMTLLNPEGNPYNFMFTITLDGAIDVLYVSGLVEPGMCIREFTPLWTPGKGEHGARLTIRAYDPVNLAEVSYANASFELIVE